LHSCAGIFSVSQPRNILHILLNLIDQGVVNVPLLYNTSRLLGKAFGDSTPTTEKDLESFVSDDRKEKHLSHSTDRRLAGSPSQGPTPSTVWSTDLISEMTMSEADSSRTPSLIGAYPTPLTERNQVAQIPANAPMTGLESIREESFANYAVMPMMRRPSQSTPRDVSFIEEFPPLPDTQPRSLTFVDSLPVRPLKLSRRPTGIPLPSNPRPPRVPPPLFIVNRSRSSPGTSPLVRERSLLTTRIATSELTYLQDSSN